MGITFANHDFRSRGLALLQRSFEEEGKEVMKTNKRILKLKPCQNVPAQLDEELL